MTDHKPGLYVVATPIGNLGDFSPRAMEILRAAAIVAAEDTRTTGTLLRLADAHPRTVSLTEHNVEKRIGPLLEAARTGVVALVSDAGTPVIADPGARLVAAAHREGVKVVAVAGPSAVAAAISAAGFEGSDFRFLGFLPRGKSERSTRLIEAAATCPVLVFFESPGRLGKTLGEIADDLGDPEVVVCRELTKLHEEVVRGAASELAVRFGETRGECTVVVQVPVRSAQTGDLAELRAYMSEMQRAGARRSGAASEASRRFGVPRDAAYECWDE